MSFCVFFVCGLVCSVCGINVIHGCHTIVPRPLILRPDFVTAGLVSFGAMTVSCSTLLGWKSISFKTLFWFKIV